MTAPKISIVVSFFNRLPQFEVCLASIARSSVKDVELVVVDDGSDSNQAPSERLIRKYHAGPLRLVRVNPEDKWYSNPCVPMNLGLSMTTGDLILLQNPEVFHVGDVLKDATGHPYEELELRSYACYSLDKDTTENLTPEDPPDLLRAKVGYLRGMGLGHRLLKKRPPGLRTRTDLWFNHTHHKPSYLHFASVITRGLAKALNGFDERFSHGTARDDVELVRRVKVCGCPRSIVNDPFVVHQWHETAYCDARKRRHNVKIFTSIEKSGFQVRANPDKEVLK